MKRFSLGLALLCFTLTSFAANKMIIPSVELKKIEAVQVSEQHGDELYYTITSYPSAGQSAHTQVPTFPHYWLSEHLAKVRNVFFWNKPLADGDSVSLVMSLIERDAPPWNNDDLIGSKQLTLKNIQGKLFVQWSEPHQKAQGKGQLVRGKHEREFEFEGHNNSKYKVTFLIK